MDVLGSKGLGHHSLPLVSFDLPDGVDPPQLLFVMGDDEGEAILADDDQYLEVYDGPSA